MEPLSLRRIRCGSDGDGRRVEASLREQLSSAGNVVSARGKALTEKVFGEPLPPTRVVERICEDVRRRGAAALFHYTEQFDRARLDADTLHGVTTSEDGPGSCRRRPGFPRHGPTSAAERAGVPVRHRSPQRHPERRGQKHELRLRCRPPCASGSECSFRAAQPPIRPRC